MRHNRFYTIPAIFTMLLVYLFPFHVFAEDTAGDYVPEGYVYTQDANYIDLSEVALMSDEELLRLDLCPLELPAIENITSDNADNLRINYYYSVNVPYIAQSNGYY